MIADSRRKVWEKIIKETVREASVVYNGRCPLTRFWRGIASALYIPQMSKRLSDYPEQLLAPFPSPPSISSPSMLFCMVTFAFKKIEKGRGWKNFVMNVVLEKYPNQLFLGMLVYEKNFDNLKQPWQP